MMLTVNGMTYEASQKIIDSCIKVAKETLKGKHAIVAIQKGNSVEMRKDVFNSKTDLMKQVVDYSKNGIRVHFIEKGKK